MKMKWKNKRKLFDPTQYKLANGCNEFAQSPQTVVFKDFVRIYFSTRKKDETIGKYLSFIAFVDLLYIKLIFQNGFNTRIKRFYNTS